MSAVVRVYADRPAIVQRFGGWVYVSVHDAEHLRMRAVLKRRIRECHPDRPLKQFGRRQCGLRGSNLYRDAVGVYRRFLRGEVRWYTEFKLEPPIPITLADLGAPANEIAPVSEKHCIECGAPFQPRNQTQAYCTKRCANLVMYRARGAA